MPRTVLDLDDELLARAGKVFGTKTKVATVTAALTEAVNRAERASFIDWLADGGLPDLSDPETMDRAWR
ncbi:MAG TPA: type II toxin-antitoxin system VapB family antitoxin [Phytomonospora sp.]